MSTILSDSVEIEVSGHPVLVLAATGEPVGSEQDALDVVGAVLFGSIQTVVIPVERLDPGFFSLSTGIAGAFVQKFVNYRRRLVIVGDTTARQAASSALRDWVREANRGPDVWFVADESELRSRLA